MKIVINPQYNDFFDFVTTIPGSFLKEGTTIYKGRNEVKIFNTFGKEFVVKSFKIPHFINKIAYSFLRMSKAERSYKNALGIVEKGFSTPVPVAYIEIKKWGLLYNSFFISEKSRFHREFREISDLPPTSETFPILDDFAQYTASLHDNNIFHKDYTPGNILFGYFDGNYAFDLVDINRLEFCQVNQEKGCLSFCKLYIADDLFRFVARKYADARGFDPDECERFVLKHRAVNN